jgi:hypothetical protein
VTNQITDLDLSGYKGMESIVLSATFSPCLRRLSLGRIDTLTLNDVLSVLENATGLVYLNIGHNFSRFEEPTQSFAPSSTLEVLDVSHCFNLTTQSLIIVLHHCPALRRLVAVKCPQVTVADVMNGEKWVACGAAVVIWK